MRVPRILLAASEREISRMLRTSLELSGREYVIVDVPSGDQAAHELGRGPVDLLVSDLHLPDMSGLELMGRLRQFNPEARSILITGRLEESDRLEAERLGAVAFIPKPIKTSFFLEAVERALRLAHPPEARIRVQDEGRARLASRLMGLLSDLGAMAAYLIDENGTMVVQAGELGHVNLKEAIAPLIAAFRAGLKVSSLFGSLLPSNFHYLDGDTYDVYLTNVGSFYGLLIVFDGKQDPGMMGKVVEHGRQAASDMLSALSRLGAGVRPTGPLKAAEPPKKSTQPLMEEAPGTARPVPDEASRFWDQAAASSGKGPAEGGALSFDQARELGLIPDQPEE